LSTHLLLAELYELLLTNRAAWAKSIAKPAQKFPLTPQAARSGAVQKVYKVNSIRKSTARLERGGMY
jgi:hypothetical protein